MFLKQEIKKKKNAEEKWNDVNKTVLVNEEEVKKRRTGYYGHLLNVDERREAEVPIVGMEVRGSGRVADPNEVRFKEVRD